MATQKNPLSSLLHSDKRKQAQDFQRDLVLRSSVRQGGQWGVRAQDTLPASQTNLGMLAASLSSFSGLLSQYTQYQLDKEKEIQRGKDIQQAIKLEGVQQSKIAEGIAQQGLRTQQVDERIKQQEISTDVAQQKAANAEWDNWWSTLNLEQQEEYRSSAMQGAQQAKADMEAAESAIDTAVGQVPRHMHPLGQVRAMRRMGASLVPDYQNFFKERLEDLMVELNDSQETLTPETAQEAVYNILDEYFESKGIDPTSEVGKGLMMATDGINAQLMPTSAQKLLDEEEEIATSKIQSALSSAPLSTQKPSETITPYTLEAYKNADPENTTLSFYKKQLETLTDAQRQEVDRKLGGAGNSAELMAEGIGIDEDTIRIGIQAIADVKNKVHHEIPPFVENPVVQELLTLPSEEILSILFGSPANPNTGKKRRDGLITIMGGNEKGARKFQAILNELAEVAMVDGKLLKDHMRYGNWLAQAEANIANAAANDSKKEEALLTAAMRDMTPIVSDWYLSNPPEKREELNAELSGASGAIVGKERLKALMPELAETIDSLPDTDYAYRTFIDSVRKNGETALTNRAKVLDPLLSQITSAFLNYSEVGPFDYALTNISNETEFPEVKTYIEELRQKYKGYGGAFPESARVTDTGMYEMLFKDRHNHVMVQYKRELEKIYDTVQKGRQEGNFNSQEWQANVSEELLRINTEFKDNLRKSIENRYKESEAEEQRITAEQDAAIKLHEAIPPGGMIPLEQVTGESVVRQILTKRQGHILGVMERHGLTTESGIIDVMNANIRPSYEESKSVTKDGSIAAEDLKIDLNESKAVLDAAKVESKEGADDYLMAFALSERAMFDDTAGFHDYSLNISKQNEFSESAGVMHPQSILRTALKISPFVADKALPSTQPYQTALCGVVDKINGTFTYAGRHEKTVEIYNQYTNDLISRTRRQYAFSVPGGIQEALDFAQLKASVGGDIIVHDADNWLGRGISPYKKKHDSTSRDSDGDIIISQRWKDTRKHITLSNNHFEEFKPVIKGLPLGKESVDEFIESTGISEAQLGSLQRAYGFATPKEFLDYQYSHPYYMALKLKNQ